MAVIKGSTQKELRQHVRNALAGRQIEDIYLEAETTKGEPKDGYETILATGRVFIHITASKKP